MSMDSCSTSSGSSSGKSELDPVKLVEETLKLQETSEVDHTERGLWEKFIELCYQYKNGTLLQTKFEMAKDVTVEKTLENSEFIDFLTLFNPIFSFVRENSPEKLDPLILTKLLKLKDLGYLPFINYDQDGEFSLFHFADVKYPSIPSPSKISPRKRRNNEETDVQQKRRRENEEMEDRVWWKYLSAILLYRERRGHFPSSRDETIVGDDKIVFEVGKWLERERKRLSKYYNSDSDKYTALTDLMAQGLWTE